jgi:hypothetical protein
MNIGMRCHFALVAATVAVFLLSGFAPSVVNAQGPGNPPPDGGFGGPPPAGGPDGPPPDGGPGGPPPGGGFQQGSVTLLGAYTLDGGTAASKTGQIYTSDKKNVSGIYIKNGGKFTLQNAIVTTTGNSSSDDASSFEGLNAGVLATGGSQVTISNSKITTSGSGANGVFSYGTGTSVVITDSKIRASGAGGHGVMAVGGGSMSLANVDIYTSEGHAAAIATDRGGGTINVTGGNLQTTGFRSPGLYSTGSIDVTSTKIRADAAEAAVIEGQNEISLTNCDVTGCSSRGVMLYQSFSGDAQGRSSHFTMKGGSLTAEKGPLFYVTNAQGEITLSGAAVTAKSGVLVDASAGQWGNAGSNGGAAVFNAENETLKGDLECDSTSSITAKLTKATTLTGAVKGAAITLDSSSKWIVTGDSTITELNDTDGVKGDKIVNIVGNGHTVTYDKSQAANLGGKTYTLANGGRLTPV